MVGRIHSVESFGTVDGPGVRFVVFMQGCPLRCLYCHNPDTWNYAGGIEMTSDEILNEYDKVKAYLKNGGITVTGGEPLLQIDFVLELITKAKQRGIHTCIDTSGVVFASHNEKLMKKFEQLLEVTDLFLLDIKHIDPKEHEKLTGMSNETVFEFAKYLSDYNKDVWIRHVVVPEITYDEKALYELGYYLGELTNIKALDVLPYHTMGNVKYHSLGLEYPLKDMRDLKKEEAKKARDIILYGMRERMRSK